MPKQTRYPWRPASRELKEAAEACARSMGQSLNDFINMAVAQRVRRWRDPLTGRVVANQKSREDPYRGWLCGHGSHGDTPIPAVECPGKRVPQHRKSWFSEELGRDDYDVWLGEQTQEAQDE